MPRGTNQSYKNQHGMGFFPSCLADGKYADELFTSK